MRAVAQNQIGTGLNNRTGKKHHIAPIFPQKYFIFVDHLESVFPFTPAMKGNNHQIMRLLFFSDHFLGLIDFQKGPGIRR